MSAAAADKMDQYRSSSMLSDIKERLAVTNLITQLDIADGLKELLINSGITLESLLNASASDFARILGIDEYVAKLVSDAIKAQAGT